MMGGLLHPRGSNVPAASAPGFARGTRFTRSWLGGFNLLPYRQRNARLARRRCVLECIAAAFAGCAAVLALAGWQALEKARLDAQRVSIEQSLARFTAPLAEHAGLLRAQDEQRQGAARAKTLSEPLTHLRDLLDALSFEPGDGVVLQQLRQREHETELLASSRGHLASAEWLKRLSAIRGVTGAEVSDLHRSAPPRSAGVAAGIAEEVAGQVAGQVEFGARLRWDDPMRQTAHVATSAARRPVKSEQSRGVK